MAISDRAMQAEPTRADQWISDDWGRGEGRFIGRITPGGTRSFYFRYTRNDGTRDTLLIGSYDPSGRTGYTLKAARAKAQEWSRLYRDGVRDLRCHFAQEEEERQRQLEEKRRQENEARRAAEEAERQAALERERRLTMRELFDRWAATELTPRPRADGTRAGRKDGGQYTREQFERRLFPKWGDVPVQDVRKADLLSILDEVKAEGKLRTANVLLSDMKQMLRFALAREIVERNVLDTVTKRDAGGKETERDRVLSVAEIGLLAQRLSAARLNPRSQVALWVILATGCRVGELMNADWCHVDMERRRWHLPETKNQRKHDIHLSDFALQQFERLQRLREPDEHGRPSPWVFPNSEGSGPVDIKSFGKQLADRQRQPERRLQGRSRNTDSLALPGGKWTAHDLRRTAASLMADLGISGDVIDECLNHVIESRVRRTYIRNRREAGQVHAFDMLGRHLQDILAGWAMTTPLPLRSPGT